MIARDLCKVSYQTLLITYLELTIKNAWNAWIKKLIQNVNLSDLKMIDYIKNAKNLEKDVLSQ